MMYVEVNQTNMGRKWQWIKVNLMGFVKTVCIMHMKSKQTGKVMFVHL